MFNGDLRLKNKYNTFIYYVDFVFVKRGNCEMCQNKTQKRYLLQKKIENIWIKWK